MVKEYIRIDAIWQKGGRVIPARIYLDGRCYSLKVQRITPLETTKRGGTDYRYDVLVNGRPDVLYFERRDTYTAAQRWYRYEESQN